MAPSAGSSSEARTGSFLVVGGPTVAFDAGGLRFLTDPTFDAPGDYGALRKVEGPAVGADELAPIDVVLISHAAHADNLDHAGRALALTAPLVLAPPQAAEGLGERVHALAPWDTIALTGGVEVTAVPARHGPADGGTDADGFVNCEVTGYIVRAGEERIYVSGDNASLALLTEIHERVGRIDHAILNAGRASMPSKLGGRPLSLTAEGAAAAAQVLGAPHVVVAHQTGWEHFTQGPADTERACTEAGIASVLDTTPLGHWSER